MNTRWLLLMLLAGALACQSKPRGHPSREVDGPERHTRRDLDLSAEQEAYLAELAAAADARPNDFAALRASGFAHMEFTLAGVLRLRDRAERDLEAAFALDSTDADLNRSLGRFYNLRAVAGDFSKAEMQVKVYAALLGDRDPMRMPDEEFVAYSFFMLGQILADKNRGRNFDALRKGRQARGAARGEDPKAAGQRGIPCAGRQLCVFLRGQHSTRARADGCGRRSHISKWCARAGTSCGRERSIRRIVRTRERTSCSSWPRD